ncbi:MAG: tRNA (adenosine(37)-N6)-threonylcarbamoyltransferase complex ATPase subunit type 1 TsaE [Thermoguttaceae bacterium]
MQTTSILISNISDMDRLGAALGHLLPVGSVLALSGTLGAGKTRLVQGVGKALGLSDGVVTSPTFVLLHEYVGTKPIYHFDTYRLESSDEFRRLGPDDYFEGDGLTFVEWADKFPDVMPNEYIKIHIDIIDAQSRRCNLTPVGTQYISICEQITKKYVSETVKN